MAEKIPYQKETPFLWFLFLSLVLNIGAALSGYYLRIPEQKVAPDIELSAIDANDVAPLGDLNAAEPPPPSEPAPPPPPTPPPIPEPTPPPLDKLPEFEVPTPTPTPTPTATPESTPTPEPKSTPRATPRLEAHLRPNIKSTGTAHSNPNGNPGSVKGSPTGAPNGTGNGSPRGSVLLRSPKPPYPEIALQMHITGDVRLLITVENGNIVDVDASGPPVLASAAARWVKAHWKFSPSANGRFTLPMGFELH